MVILAPTTLILDDQLMVLNGTIFDDLMNRRRDPEKYRLTRKTSPDMPAMNDARHRYERPYPYMGGWENPSLPLEHQPALQALVAKVAGFVVCHRLTTTIENHGTPAAFFEARIYDRRAGPQARFIVRAFPRTYTSNIDLLLQVVYFPPT
jgi:hypothetical protein